MGRLRSRLARLRKKARGQLASFDLASDEPYSFSPREAWPVLFRFWCDSLQAVHHGTPRPDPPEILRAVADARDRQRALEAIYPEGIAHWCPLDREALVSRGELRERPLVAHRVPE